MDYPQYVYDDEPPKPPKPTINALFCDASADVTFKSSDNVLFKIHSKHLTTTSAGFALPAASTHIGEDPVILEEHSNVLEILFQLIHPRTEAQNFRQPSIMNLEMKLFFDLAEVAEKYLVFGAMATCEARMHMLYASHPIEVLNHCSKHGYDSLADKAAPFTIPKSTEDIVKGLTFPGLIARWVKYYGKWLEVPRFANSLLLEAPNFSACKRLPDAVGTLCRSATLDPRITQLGRIDTSLHCPYAPQNCFCHNITQWQWKIDQKVQAIPLFSHVKV